MERFEVGHMIEHNLMPGMPMRVEAVRDCENGGHSAYQVTDPEGAKDWLCQLDVHAV